MKIGNANSHSAEMAVSSAGLAAPQSERRRTILQLSFSSSCALSLLFFALEETSVRVTPKAK